MKKFLILNLVLQFILINCVACRDRNTESVLMDYKNSSFRHFYVEDNTVHIVCTLTFQNIDKRDLKFCVTGYSEEDVNCGLLSDPTLSVLNMETNDEFFYLPAGTTKQFDVEFYGKYGGELQKANRLLPNVIEIKVLD